MKRLFIILLFFFLIIIPVYAYGDNGNNNSCVWPEAKAENVIERIGRDMLSEKSISSPQKYAVLISGLWTSSYSENLSLAYQVLLEEGFRRENIYILDETGKRSGYYPADGISSEDSIKIVFGYLGSKIKKEDLLFVYVTDHGRREVILDSREEEIIVSALILPGEKIFNELEFISCVKGIKSEIKIFFFDQCFGGGFAERVYKEGYIGIAQSIAKKPSFGPYFPRSFFSAFREEAADADKNRKIDIKEAFDYAVKNNYFGCLGLESPIFLTPWPDKKIYLD